ncbi:MAG: hypothetical protein QM679_03630 [Patulibacter sp.]
MLSLARWPAVTCSGGAAAWGRRLALLLAAAWLLPSSASAEPLRVDIQRVTLGKGALVDAIDSVDGQRVWITARRVRAIKKTDGGTAPVYAPQLWLARRGQRKAKLVAEFGPGHPCGGWTSDPRATADGGVLLGCDHRVIRVGPDGGDYQEVPVADSPGRPFESRDGTIYYGASKWDIGIIRTDGTQLTVRVQPNGCYDFAFAQTSDGRVWFSAFEQREVGTIDPDGNVTHDYGFDDAIAGASATTIGTFSLHAGADGNLVKIGGDSIFGLDRPVIMKPDHTTSRRSLKLPAPSSEIKDIVADQAETLWATTGGSTDDERNVTWEGARYFAGSGGHVGSPQLVEYPAAGAPRRFDLGTTGIPQQLIVLRDQSLLGTQRSRCGSTGANLDGTDPLQLVWIARPGEGATGNQRTRADALRAIGCTPQPSREWAYIYQWPIWEDSGFPVSFSNRPSEIEVTLSGAGRSRTRTLTVQPHARKVRVAVDGLPAGTYRVRLRGRFHGQTITNTGKIEIRARRG